VDFCCWRLSHTSACSPYDHHRPEAFHGHANVVRQSSKVCQSVTVKNWPRGFSTELCTTNCLQDPGFGHFSTYCGSEKAICRWHLT
jgi:hypothetical protein